MNTDILVKYSNLSFESKCLSFWGGLQSNCAQDDLKTTTSCSFCSHPMMKTKIRLLLLLLLMLLLSFFFHSQTTFQHLDLYSYFYFIISLNGNSIYCSIWFVVKRVEQNILYLYLCRMFARLLKKFIACWRSSNCNLIHLCDRYKPVKKLYYFNDK